MTTLITTVVFGFFTILVGIFLFAFGVLVAYFIRGLVVDITPLLERRKVLTSRLCEVEKLLNSKELSAELKYEISVLEDHLSFDAKNQHFSESIVGFVKTVVEYFLAICTPKGWRRGQD